MSRVLKSGGSLVVIVPDSFVKAVGVRKGDTVEVEVWPEKGKMTYKFKGCRQLPLMNKTKN